MAKAKAICTCSACGKQFTKEAIRYNRAQADSWEEWAAGYYDTCPDCQKAARQEQAAEYAAEAKEDGLPELKGSVKQVEWAERIRHEKIVAVGDCIQTYREKGKDKTVAKMELTLSYILTISSASWWIDNRYHDSLNLLNSNYRAALDAEAVRMAEPAQKEKKEEPEEKDDAVVMPENAQHGIANIVAEKGKVGVYYPKDDTFRSIMKEAGFSWNPNARCWEKEINGFTGSAIDRAADIANRLLTAGFSINCKNAEIREKAVSGNFESECKRWIKMFVAGSYKGWLAISIPKSDSESQKLYDAARKIKGSKWDSGSVAVPVAKCDQVEDFAEIYGYKLSNGAKGAINEYRNAKTIRPAAPKAAEQKDILGDILKSSPEVLPDLKDED